MCMWVSLSKKRSRGREGSGWAHHRVGVDRDRGGVLDDDRARAGCREGKEHGDGLEGHRDKTKTCAAP